MGIITLILLIVLELFLLLWSIWRSDDHRQERAMVRIGTLALFGVLLASGVYVLSFRYLFLVSMLAVQALAGAVILIGRKELSYRTSKAIFRFMRNCIFIILALAPAIVFPQYAQPTPTGSYPVATKKVTWIDTSRLDAYAQSGENRTLTVEFWYPQTTHGTYPLVLFSHGAFGFSGSNYSTFVELASHGYVVASIGHTHHALFTLDTKGKLTTVDPDFMAQASDINDQIGYDEEIFTITQEWMKLRVGDEQYILDAILAECEKHDAETPFSRINAEKIGLMGHSLGGASSAQIGRERSDIDAVIVLDGTMLGEEIAYENHTVVLNDKPYPVPLLNMYAQDHYTNAKNLGGDTYSNFHASLNGLVTYETVVRNAGHLNFTDLPLFSPLLAKKLGVGTIDPWYCIETMNATVLEFFNSFLKDRGLPDIAKEQ